MDRSEDVPDNTERNITERRDGERKDTEEKNTEHNVRSTARLPLLDGAQVHREREKKQRRESTALGHLYVPLRIKV